MTYRISLNSQPPAAFTLLLAALLLVGSSMLEAQVPVITSLSPSNANAGAPGFTLTVNGTNFLPTSVVQWNGSARTTFFPGVGQLTAVILASDLLTPGVQQVTVFNPGTGGGTSAPAAFFINAAPAAPPVLTS